ncbi:hypothetical protein SNEBB_003774 [Seison nebaliae]|nr:hypothetical protein SNEBB_003774 [Seison nebaliae]
MGNFKGHVFPGSLYYIVGWWWAISYMRRYVLCKEKFFGSATILCNRRTEMDPIKNIDENDDWLSLKTKSKKASLPPIESLILSLFGIVGVLAELITARDHITGDLTQNGHQHVLMYSFTFLHFFVVILCHYYKEMPPKCEYITLALFNLAVGGLFHYHLVGRTGYNAHIHQFIAKTLLAAGFMSLVEAKYPNQFFIVLARPFFSISTGSWFYYVAFILYNPFSAHQELEMEHEHLMINNSTMLPSDGGHGDHADHAKLMYATFLYFFNMLIHLILLFIVYFVISFTNRKKSSRQKNQINDKYNLIVDEEVSFNN